MVVKIVEIIVKCCRVHSPGKALSMQQHVHVFSETVFKFVSFKITENGIKTQTEVVVAPMDHSCYLAQSAPPPNFICSSAPPNFPNQNELLKTFTPLILSMRHARKLV